MCGRSERGKRIEPTGKFSPAARAATSATSIPQAYEPLMVQSLRFGRGRQEFWAPEGSRDRRSPRERCSSRGPRGRARPLQRERRARSAARPLRGRTSAARRRSRSGDLHRLDRARSADRGAVAHDESPGLPARGSRDGDDARTRDLRPRQALRRARHRRPGDRSRDLSEGLLKAADLRRYADAIVKASLGFSKGETLVVRGNPLHRELVVAVAEAGYRAGAHLVDVQYIDPLVMRARLEHGKDD